MIGNSYFAVMLLRRASFIIGALFSVVVESTLITNGTYSHLYKRGRRAFGTAGVAAMIIFSVLAICLCAGAIYLLAKNKNISDVIEDAVDDGCCSGLDENVDAESLTSVVHLVQAQSTPTDIKGGNIQMSTIHNVMNRVSFIFTSCVVDNFNFFRIIQRNELLLF